MEQQPKYRKHDKEEMLTHFLVVALIIAFAATVGCLIAFWSQIKQSERLGDHAGRECDRWYCLITEDKESAFWQNVYDSMLEEGYAKDTYIEWMGRNLVDDYTKYDLLEIAINSGVDGIIVEADDSEEFEERLMEASVKDIPIVAVMQDDVAGIRKSFVGPSNYNLGNEYGNQILKAAKEARQSQIIKGEETENQQIDVLVVVEADSSATSQNLIITALNEVLESGNKSGMMINMRATSIRSDSVFGEEDAVRNMLINDEETVPDIMVCLSEATTKSAFQVLVDENMVGEVSIIGYSDSDTILKAVSKGIVYATASIDTNQMGRNCVDALDEYLNTGYVNEYYSTNFTMINRENVGEFLN